MPLFNRILHPRINWIQLPELQNTLFVLVLLLLLVLETLRVFRGQKLVPCTYHNSQLLCNKVAFALSCFDRAGLS
jgi:hypothetical protein